jgi:hypothetical protein
MTTAPSMGASPRPPDRPVGWLRRDAAWFASGAVQAAAIGIVGRAFSLTILVLAMSRWGIYDPGGPPLRPPFAIWDGAWYVSIATTGYHGTPMVMVKNGGLLDVAFFPAWPLLMKVASLNGLIPVEIAGGVLANVLAVVAAVLIYRLLEPRLGRSVGLWTVAIVSFSPAAYVMSLAYSEPLFLVVAAMSFLALSARWAAVSQLTRVTGLAVAVGVATERWIRGERAAAIWALVLPGIAFAAWWAYIAWLTGNPEGYLLGSPSWQPTLGHTTGPASMLAHPLGPAIAAYLVVLVVGVISIARRWPALAVYAGGVLLVSAVVGNGSQMPRYFFVAFPAVAGLMLIIRDDRLRLLLLASGVLFQIQLVIHIVRGGGGGP